MKNKVSVFCALSLVLFIAVGCSLGGLIGGSDNETTNDTPSKSGEKTTKKEAPPSGEIVKIGIPECDELATYINDNTDKIEGSYLARGIVYLYKNYLIENIKEGVEKMDDKEKAKAAKVCVKTLEDLKKSVEE